MIRVISFSLYFIAIISFGAGYILLRDVKAAVANPEPYKFGSITMLAQAGEAYRSLSTYVDSTLTTASIFFFCSLLMASFGSIMLFVSSTVKKEKKKGVVEW